VTHLFLSPHLDDVALSCAGRLLSLAGQPVVVATMFTEGQGRYASRYVERRRCDRRTLEAVGIEVRHMALLDAPFRLGVGWSEAALRRSPTAEDVASVERIVAALVAELEPETAWFPLAVGGHVDHLAVFGAHAVAGARARYFVDRPYCFVPGAVAARQRELGGAHVDTIVWSRARGEAAIDLIDGYEAELLSLFNSESCAATYREHAFVADGFFEETARLASSTEVG
jgi:LmbE family N-acetylglucosaminyl deacetylase